MESSFHTPTPTLAAPSLLSVASGSTHVDLEKGLSTANPLQHYVVPVLPKGLKTALTQRVSKWTEFRVWYNPYRQLFTIVVAFNAISILLAGISSFPYADRNSSAFALGNVLMAVVVRNELFLRCIFFICVTLFKKWTPLFFRIGITAFLQHLGGIHSGAGLSSLLWLAYGLFKAIITFHLHTTHLAVLLTSLFVTICIAIAVVSALPIIRERHHNAFEHHHRYAGWTGLAFTWAFVILAVGLVKDQEGVWTWEPSNLIRAQQFWFAVIITVFIFVPWTTVRKVPVEIEVPSPRTAIVKFQRGIQQGLLGRISRDPIKEYHGFGIISEGIPSRCHYMVVGAQGDWTKRIISDPPTHLYTREMKFAGLPYLSTLYRRGIMICTGSGIGAVASTCLQLDNWFLIWIGADLEATFGRTLMGMIERRLLPVDTEGKQAAWDGGVRKGERCILFDTKKAGCRPDTVQLLKDVYSAFKAEVVIITSNPSGNAELMQACRENDMHSFGPLWDS